MSFNGLRILITGGTGSLGAVLLRRLLSGKNGVPQLIRILSRDEAKQSALKAELPESATRVEFQIGDVRDYNSVATAVRGIDYVFNAAALKQVPACEYNAYEAVRTNIEGAENIISAIENQRYPTVAVIGISTDKACKPVNVMGMTKAIQERLFLSARSRCPNTKFVCVRYGNVLASRGSVIPFFKEQIKKGGPVTVTSREMTRFLLSLDQAVDTVFAACKGNSGETYIPIIKSANVIDIAHQLIGCRDIKIEVVGTRPGEKTHEILVSEEELPRTVYLKNHDGSRYYVISSVFETESYTALREEFSSENSLMDYDDLTCLLYDNGLLND